MHYLRLLLFSLATCSLAVSFDTGNSLNITYFDDANRAHSMEKRKKDTCHTRKDSIGDYCWFFNDDEFKSAMRQYCESRFGIPVIGGFDKSYPAYLPNIPDGKGGHQTFWGNIRVDRAAPGASITDGKLLAPQQCYNGMIKVFETCKGYGGWWNDGWGTFFAECIRQ